MLFLVGDEDTIVSAAAVSSLASRYPLGETHVIAGSGHLEALKKHGDDYVATVLDFLERALGRPVA